MLTSLTRIREKPRGSFMGDRCEVYYRTDRVGSQLGLAIHRQFSSGWQHQLASVVVWSGVANLCRGIVGSLPKTRWAFQEQSRAEAKLSSPFPQSSTNLGLRLVHVLYISTTVQ